MKGKYVKDFVIELMGVTRNKMHVEFLINHYEICNNKIRRQLIVKTLGILKDKRLVPVYDQAINDQPEIIEETIGQIKKLKWHELFDILINAAVSVFDKHIPFLSYNLEELYIKAINANKNELSIELLQLLTIHKRENIRKLAVKSLHDKNSDIRISKLEELLKKEEFLTLAKALDLHTKAEPIDNEPEFTVKQEDFSDTLPCIYGVTPQDLNSMTDSEILSAASLHFGKGVEHPDVLISFLEKIGNAEAKLLIRSQLNHENMSVRAKACQALLRLGDKNLTDSEMVNAALHAQAWEQHRALDYGAIGNTVIGEYLTQHYVEDLSLDVLKSFCESDHPNKHEIIVHFIDRIKNKELFKYLDKFVKSSKEHMASHIQDKILNYDLNRMYVSAGINKLIYYIGVYKNNEVVEKLIKFTHAQHKHAYIRSCADAFARIKDPRCTKALCESLSWAKEGPDLKSVIAALQKLKAKEAIEPLSNLVIKREPIAKMRDDCIEKLKNL